MSALIYKRKGYGKKTETAGTVITRLIEPMEGCFTTLVDFEYTCGTTAHTLTVMRPLGKTYASAAAAAGQAVINVEHNPGTYNDFGTVNTANNGIAGNDYVVYQTADGNYVVDTVASVSTLAITMTGNVPTAGVAKGAPFWFFGVIGDTNPADNQAHPQYTLAASSTTHLFGDKPGLAVAGAVGSVAPGGATLALYSATYGPWPLNGKNEPLVLHSGNATAQGVMERVTAVYSNQA
jgi:hypothetical protein